MFVADTRNHEVRVFGLDGAHRRTFGREGEGPGEFRNIYSIAWVGDRLLTFDPPLGRMGEFSAEGEWLGQRRTEAAGLTGSAADIRLYPVGANKVFRFALGSALGSDAGVLWVGHHGTGDTGDTVPTLTPDPPEGVDPGIFCEAESASAISRTAFRRSSSSTRPRAVCCTRPGQAPIESPPRGPAATPCAWSSAP